MNEDFLLEKCANCGLTYGAHSATSYYSDFYGMHIPLGYCPGHEGGMDWDNGPGTCFKHTGETIERIYDAPARGIEG